MVFVWSELCEIKNEKAKKDAIKAVETQKITWMNRCECTPAMGMIRSQHRLRQQCAVAQFALLAIFRSLKNHHKPSKIDFKEETKSVHVISRFLKIDGSNSKKNN